MPVSLGSPYQQQDYQRGVGLGRNGLLAQQKKRAGLGMRSGSRVQQSSANGSQGQVDPLIVALMNTNPANMRWGHWGKDGQATPGMAPPTPGPQASPLLAAMQGSPPQGAAWSHPNQFVMSRAARNPRSQLLTALGAVGELVPGAGPQGLGLHGANPQGAASPPPNPWHNQIFGNMQGSPAAGPQATPTIAPQLPGLPPSVTALQQLQQIKEQMLDRGPAQYSQANQADRGIFPVAGNQSIMDRESTQLPQGLQDRVNQIRMMDRSSMPQGLTPSAQGIMSREAPQQAAPTPGGLSPEVQQFQQDFLKKYAGRQFNAESPLDDRIRRARHGLSTRRSANTPDSIVMVDPETGNPMLVGRGTMRDGQPRNPAELQANAEAERAQLQGRINRRNGLTYGGEQMGLGPEGARQNRIARRAGAVNPGRQAYIQDMAQQKGMTGPFGSNARPGGQSPIGAALSGGLQAPPISTMGADGYETPNVTEISSYVQQLRTQGASDEQILQQLESQYGSDAIESLNGEVAPGLFGGNTPMNAMLHGILNSRKKKPANNGMSRDDYLKQIMYGP